MSSGHKHNSSAGTQNQGNSLGDRSCVRQSKLYRKYESGNDIKSILGTTNLCWNPDVKEGAYAGQQVFDHTKPSSLADNNSYRGGDDNSSGRISKYKHAADDMRNYINGSNDSYKSMKGNIINNNYNDENMMSKLPPPHKGSGSSYYNSGGGGGGSGGGGNNIFPTNNNNDDSQYYHHQQQQSRKQNVPSMVVAPSAYNTSRNSSGSSGGGNSSSIAAALMGHGQTDYSFRDKKKEVDYSRSNINPSDDYQQYNNSSRVTANTNGGKGFSSNMGGLSISQFQQQALVTKPSQPTTYGTNSSNIAGALSGYGQEDYSFRSKQRDYSVDPRAYYDQPSSNDSFQIGATKQQQSTRRQSFDGSLGSVGNSKSVGSLGIVGRQQINDIPGLPSNNAPYGYDDYQYMNHNNNQGNNYSNNAIDDYQMDDRKIRRESKSTRPW